MTDWKEFRLGEIATIVDCEHKTAPLVEWSDYISVRTANISNGKINFDSCNRVSEEVYNQWSKRLIPKEGDIILAREAPVGEVGYVPNNRKVCLGQRTVLIRTEPEHIIDKYLLYYLVNDDTKFDLISRSTGSVVEHLNVNDIRDFDLRVHSELNTQAAIAEVLSSLDDKIDLLHRQNKTLEAIAETLFRQWFIEEAEEGWEVVQLWTLGKIICGKTPSKKIASFFDGGTPLIKIPDMHGRVFVFESEDSLSDIGVKSQANKTIPPKSICVSCIATVGLVVMNAKKSQTNQQINTIIPNKDHLRYFLFLKMKSLKDELLAMASGGTATDNLNTGDFSNIDIILPDEDILRDFSEIVNPLFDKIYTNQTQIRTLTQLRDTLLPKLMSGEVRVG
jgi:type I restriction enzyme, S subunit